MNVPVVSKSCAPKHDGPFAILGINEEETNHRRPPLPPSLLIRLLSASLGMSDATKGGRDVDKRDWDWGKRLGKEKLLDFVRHGKPAIEGKNGGRGRVVHFSWPE